MTPQSKFPTSHALRRTLITQGGRPRLHRHLELSRVSVSAWGVKVACGRAPIVLKWPYPTYCGRGRGRALSFPAAAAPGSAARASGGARSHWRRAPLAAGGARARGDLERGAVGLRIHAELGAFHPARSASASSQRPPPAPRRGRRWRRSCRGGRPPPAPPPQPREAARAAPLLRAAARRERAGEPEERRAEPRRHHPAERAHRCARRGGRRRRAAAGGTRRSR